MQNLITLASLRKQTKSGVSTWRFLHDAETDRYFAVGGEQLKLIPATSKKHLLSMYENFKSYGYRKELAMQLSFA